MKRCYIVNKLEDLEFLKIFEKGFIHPVPLGRIEEFLSNGIVIVVYYNSDKYDGWNRLEKHINSIYGYYKEIDLSLEIRKWKLKQIDNFLF